MRRGYNAARQREFIERLRGSIPGLFMRSAFIVGHPGETDEDFDALLAFVREAELDHVGAFRYSHEEGTHSGTLEALVEPKLIERRARELMRVQRTVSKRRLKALIGTQREVLIEGESPESELLLVGRHAGQAPDVDGQVHLINGSGLPGELRQVLITHTADYDLVGDLSLGQDAVAGTRPVRAPKPAPRSKRLTVVS
jgi:ribosomal protein S12 methylthiotransferase